MTVDERHTQDEVLRETNHGVVDRRVTVWMKLSHHIADDARRLHMAAVGTQPHLRHLIEDAALYRLEAVTSIRQGPRVDD